MFWYHKGVCYTRTFTPPMIPQEDGTWNSGSFYQFQCFQLIKFNSTILILIGQLWWILLRLLCPAKKVKTLNNVMKLGSCHNNGKCKDYVFAGIEEGRHCWCGDAMPDKYLMRPASECNVDREIQHLYCVIKLTRTHVFYLTAFILPEPLLLLWAGRPGLSPHSHK